jgi:hypothetical protein
MHIRTVADLNNGLTMSSNPSRYALGSVTLPFAYAFGMVSAAPSTASADWVTAALWTSAMVVLDGILPLLRCWMQLTNVGVGVSTACSQTGVELYKLSPGFGVLARLAAGLLYWYLRAMGELRSVHNFLHTRQETRRRNHALIQRQE